MATYLEFLQAGEHVLLPTYDLADVGDFIEVDIDYTPSGNVNEMLLDLNFDSSGDFLAIDGTNNQVRFRVNNDLAVSSDNAVAAGRNVIRLQRTTASDFVVSVGGSPVLTHTPSNPNNVNVTAINRATNNAAQFCRMDLYAASTHDRNYDLATSSGTELNETLLNQDGTLTNFVTGGFVTVGGDSITITTQPYRIWQKSNSNDASVTIDGSYSGTVTSIERSLNGGAYQVAVANPSGGAWSDTFTLPVGQHTLSYRFSNNTGIVDTITPVAVGSVFVCAGQSNISGRGDNNQTFSDSAGGITAYLYGNDENFKQLVDPYDSDTNQVRAVSADSNAGGSWVVRFANYWLANNEIPVGFIPCAKGGTTISQWSRDTNPGTLYGSMLERINAVGGCESILWEQGESDARGTNNTDGAVYQAALEQLAADINSDFSVNTFVIPLHTITDPAFTNQSAIRQAQIDAASASANIEIGQPLTDIDISDGDGIHFTKDDELDTVAFRMHQSYTGQTSDLTLNIGAPNGTYKTYLIDQSDNIVYNGSATFSSGSTTITSLAVAAGTALEGYVIDNESPHVNGAVITGVTA